MTTLYRTCKNCKEELLGRSDKKFCSDTCKSDYHNEYNPKKRAFKSFCKNEQEIRSGFKTLKSIIQTKLEKTKNRKLLNSKDTDVDLDIEFELLKNYDLLSQIRKIEGLLYN